MRYIRTKDGKIYDTKDLTKCDDKRFPNGWFTEYGVALLSIKEADTIEELCDEAVVKETWRDRPIVIQIGGCSNRFDCARGLYLGKPTTESIWGAIWVDGNLIKVAQMNEKGELELL